MVVSMNVDSDKPHRLSTLVGIDITEDLGKYLGMPLLKGRMNKHTHSFLSEKVASKIAGCKSKILSQAARALLIQNSDLHYCGIYYANDPYPSVCFG